jgi:hypothetical protein
MEFVAFHAQKPNFASTILRRSDDARFVRQRASAAQQNLTARLTP